MYIPKSYLFADKKNIIEFIKRFSFGTVISIADGKPIATHLPFLISEREDRLIITSHFALGNPQWKAIEKGNTLIIFSEPHAYISPSNYESEINVPTWNYVSVHLYGSCKIIEDPISISNIIDSTIDNYEISYKQQWNNLPEDFKTRMMKGIVAFEMTVDDVQGKKKISQNKSKKDQERVMNTLSQSKDTNEQLIAEYMREHIETLP